MPVLSDRRRTLLTPRITGCSCSRTGIDQVQLNMGSQVRPDLLPLKVVFLNVWSAVDRSQSLTIGGSAANDGHMRNEMNSCKVYGNI